MEKRKSISWKYSTLLAILFFLILSCSKEPAIDARVDIKLLDSTAYINQQLSFVVEGKGDFCTFFSGISGKQYDSLPDSRGNIVNFGDTIKQTYQLAGEYTVTAIASSYGNWGDESDRDVAQLTISVADNITDIVRVFMTKPSYRLATIQQDTILISAGDIDLSSITLQVITVSQEAVIYPNGDRTTAYPGGEEFPGNFSGADPHIIVESPAKTTKKYPIRFN